MTAKAYPSALAEGALLQGGKYRIERVLGQGGFGITYLGTQVVLRRRVAIKEFFMCDYCDRAIGTSKVTIGSRGGRTVVDRFRGKFIKEAQTIASLDHPHIIRIHDIFEEHGTAYYVMEHIAGGSLSDLVSRSGHLDEATALGYIRQIGEALSYLHEQSNPILHLDVKPSNVLLKPGTGAVLIDFGISKRYDETGGQTSTTPPGISKGYAPIEQYTQGGISKFSPATDVYSLGATLYKLLTSQTPPEAIDLYDESLPTAPLTAQGVSAATQAAILRAMMPGRKQRYQSVGAMLSALSVHSDAGAAPSDSSVGLQDDIVVEETVINGQPAGHAYVDLGLSVKWATCNVGASSPSDYGNYYAWGETTTKSTYTEANSKTYGKDAYNRDIGGDASLDAARANWGGTWRLPTEAEFQELIDNCTWTWTTQGGHNGYKVTSKKNGNSIFLPAAGWRYGSSLDGAGEHGGYWSSSPHGSYSFNARYLYFGSSYHYTYWYRRDYGQSVRPVSE